MRKQQRNALLTVLTVLVAAGLMTLFILAPWRTSGAPTTPPGQEPVPTAVPEPGHSGTLVVKIDNVAEARPQTGLGSAGIVYVQPVEGGLTRLVAIYQQQRPELAGPVRSARQTDVDLLAQYGRPVLAFSGAAPEVLPMLDPLVKASPDEIPTAYFRDTHRHAPHNLYLRPGVLPVSGVDTSILQTGAAPSGGIPVTTKRISFPAATYDVTWSDGQWLLTFDGSRLVSTESGQVKAATVVVQRVTVNQGRLVEDVTGTLSPVAVTTGSGPVTVLRDGMSFEGTWSRPAAADPTRFTTQDGSVLPVASGPVWIMLVPR